MYRVREAMNEALHMLRNRSSRLYDMIQNATVYEEM